MFNNLRKINSEILRGNLSANEVKVAKQKIKSTIMEAHGLSNDDEINNN